MGKVHVYACVSAPTCLLMCIHIFTVCVYSISLDVCVYTPGLPSVTHSDIDLCMASVCVCACTHIPTIIGIQISSHKSIQLLPFFNRRSPSQGPNSMRGNKLKRMALIAHIQINKWR